MTAVKQNEWLRKLVPDEFTDVDVIFENVLFEGLIFFWEKDGGQESLHHNSIPWEDEFLKWTEDRRECYVAMKAAYEWAKTYKDAEPVVSLSELEDYRVRMQTWEDTTSEHLLNIIKYRNYLWT